MIIEFNQALLSNLLYDFVITRFTSRWSKGSAPRPTPSPNFVVNLKVGSKEFVGEGSTAQAAKHSAATKALQILKVISLIMPIRSLSSVLL